jgi:hypothetical protein
MLMGMFDKLKTAASVAASAVNDAAASAASAVASAAADAFNASIDRLKDWIEEVAAGSDQLEQVGYRLADLQLELSLSPRVIVELLKVSQASDEAFQAVLANNADRKTLCTLVRMAQQATRAERRLAVKGRRFEALEVELGFPPVARMRYAPVEEAETSPPAQPEPEPEPSPPPG